MLALLVGMAAAGTMEVASHHGVWTGVGMEWRSEIRLSEADIVTLAVPLPANVEVLEGSQGSVGRDEDGRITAVRFLSRKGTLLLRQPVADPELTVTLRPPLVGSDSPQRVTLAGLDFRPDEALGMDLRVLCATHPEISAEQRREIDERVSGRRARLAEQPIYLIADYRLSAGLVGTVSNGRRISMGFGVAAGGGFGALLSLLALAYRGLEQRARAEKAEAYLKREFIRPPPS